MGRGKRIDVPFLLASVAAPSPHGLSVTASEQPGPPAGSLLKGKV